MFIPMFSIHPNPDFLKALNSKILSENDIQGYKSEYGKKYKLYKRITAVYIGAFLLMMLIGNAIPCLYTAIPMVLIMCPGALIMYPIMSSCVTYHTILSLIDRNYPNL